MTTDQEEAVEAKRTLGIGLTVEERISKLRANGFQYASAGDTRALIEEIERLRGMIQFIGETGEDMAKELYPVGCEDYQIEDGRRIYTGPWTFIMSKGDTFIEAIEAEMRDRGRLKP